MKGVSPPAAPIPSDDLSTCWTEALDLWGVAIDLSPPVEWKPEGPGQTRSDEPLAYIDLEIRQVVVNLQLLKKIGAQRSLTAVLAHEIGHHIRFPHTLGLAAQLEMLQQRLLPGSRSLTNLFFDLQVNEWVGRSHAAPLQAVYQGFMRSQAITDPVFCFYLAIYEELWGLDAGSLIGPDGTARMDREQPVWRAEATVFAQTFWAIPDVFLQFVYFCSRFAPYLPDDNTPMSAFALSGDVAAPDADDYANALTPSAAADEAVRQAVKRGWVEAGAVASEEDPLAKVSTIGAGKPGTERVEFQRRVVAKHYRRLVDQHLFEVPPRKTQTAPEPSIPGTTEDWEWGDAPAAIDWVSTVRAAGVLAPAMPLKRTLWVDEPAQEGLWIPAIEIYLDTSGSMPDPKNAVNPMTLAAQILAAATIRRGGRIRAVVYSWGEPLVSDWLYEEERARDFLLNYSGGGTDFPFALAEKFSQDTPDAIRIILSDSDFIYNLSALKDPSPWRTVLDRSGRVVTMLQLYAFLKDDQTGLPFDHPKYRLLRVEGMADFARTAKSLADALFGN